MSIGCGKEQVDAALKKWLPNYEKHKSMDFGRLLRDGDRSDAIARSRAADLKHSAEGREIPENRPSSGVAELIDRIDRASRQGR